MIWPFLVLYQIKHFICDFPLQNSYMLGKFKPWPHFVGPLAAHALVQALGTAVLCFIFSLPWYVILVDFVSHFIIDRLKADKNLLGRWTTNQPQFWWALGLDQMLHQFVGIWMATLCL